MNPREIGKTLRDAREKKGITPDKIWNATRIQGKIVEALEEGTADNILSRVYVLLFLKKYAGFLGLDGASLVEDYKAFSAPPEEQILSIDEKPEPVSIDVRKWALLAAWALALLMSVYFVLFLGAKLTSFYRARRRAAPPPAAQTATGTRLDKNAQKIFPIPKSKAIDLTLKSSDKVWMKVWKDGKVVFEGTLGKKATKSWSADNDIKLWTGRAEALKLSINGTLIGEVGRGNIKSIEISRNGIRVKRKWLLKAQN